jgi:hypothetical protein
MAEQPLVRAGETPPRSQGKRNVAVAVAALAIIAAAAAGAWWYFTMREAAPDWDRAPDVSLAAPAGDAFRGDTPWVSLRLAPARADQPNSIRAALVAPSATPAPSGTPAPTLAGVSLAPVAATDGAKALTFQPDFSPESAVTASAALDQSGWWHMTVTVSDGPEPAEFYLLIPDPNVNGPGAVPPMQSSSEAETLFRRGLDGITSLQSVRYTQWLADGRGNAGFSEHAVSAGGNGRPAGFTYRAPGGMEAIVIESTRWIKLPGDLGWTKQEGVVTVPPSQWGEEYAGATQFTILGEETVDGAKTQILAFLVPETVQPRRSAAWYLWWVDSESGRVRREAMVSRFHYMLNRFSEFDVPVELNPPPEPASPAAGTPTP